MSDCLRPFWFDFWVSERSRATSQKDKYQYNGKEKLTDLDLGWSEYGARMYMAENGRWNGVDALSELDFENSAYIYVGNNPINHIDMFGMYPVKVTEADGTKWAYDSEDGTPVILGKKPTEGFFADMQKGYQNPNYGIVNEAIQKGGEDGAKFIFGSIAGIFALGTGSLIASAEGVGYGIHSALPTLAQNYLTSLTWKSIGRKAAFNIFGQGYAALITGDKKIDFVGLFTDTLVPGLAGAALGGYLEGGVQYKNGKWETFKEPQGYVKGSIRTVLGGMTGKYQDMIGGSGVNKAIENVYETMGKVFTESHEALFDKIENEATKK